jgi:hypothetical protein
MALSDVIKQGAGAPLAGDLIVGGIGIDTASGKLYIKKANNTITSPGGTGTETSNTPSGSITATNVQAAINQLDTTKEPADSTILKDVAIGVTVQAYDVTLEVGANNYVHPSYSTTNVVTSGSTIIDSITTTADGHISAMSTRVLTPANIGALSTTGIAASATKLDTPRAIALTGDVTGTADFDGSAALNIITTVANDSHTHTPANVALGNLSDNGNSLAGDFTATGNVTAYSDIRVKVNIAVIPDALNKVQQLSGYTFDRTDSRTPRQSGVIAQEVQLVLPEVVVANNEGHLSVAYGNMVGLLIEAIKELKDEVDELKGAR